ncbi:MAG TPA: mucin desulfatase, partial [Acidobacteriota bacterium]|nr:mucin desulfatase [Acidobacteriota bacterium]
MAGHDLETVVQQFDLPGDFVRADPYGTGHINDTYAVLMDQGESQVRYIFQRINNNVFPDPPKVMENIVRVTSQVRSVLESEGIADASRRTLTVIPTREGQGFWQETGQDGGFWRSYIFIENARSYDTLQDPRQAFEAARAFGRFQRLLVDLPGEPLHETIPDFHDGPKRFRDFEEAAQSDASGR